MKLRFEYLFYFSCLMIFSGFFILRLFIVASKGTDIAGIEQNVIYSIQTLLHNGRLYTSPSTAPFAITQYTPIYYYICGLTAKICGYKAYDVQMLYWIGRSWDLLFNVITACIIYRIGTAVLFLSKYKSLFLLVLAFTLTMSHNFAVRPDSLTDLLGIAAIYSYMRYYQQDEKHKKSDLRLLLTVFLTALAVFTKQSGIQLILIFGVFTLLIKDWPTLLKLIIFSLMIYGAMLFLFMHLYSSFLENVVGGIANGISIPNFLSVITKTIVVVSVWPLAVISLFLLLRNNLLLKGNIADRILATCTLGSFVFAIVTALKMGSTPQYFILFVNLSLLLMMKSFQQHIRYKYRLPAYAYLLLMILAYGVSATKLLMYNDHNQSLEKQRYAASRTAAFIKKDQQSMEKKYIFSNVTTDSTIPSRQSLNNTFFKNCLVPQMDILEYSTGPSKVVGYENLENLIRKGQVEYIIESAPQSKFILLARLESIKTAKFHLVKKIDGYLIYKLLPNQ